MASDLYIQKLKARMDGSGITTPSQTPQTSNPKTTNSKTQNPIRVVKEKEWKLLAKGTLEQQESKPPRHRWVLKSPQVPYKC